MRTNTTAGSLPPTVNETATARRARAFQVGRAIVRRVTREFFRVEVPL